MRAETGRIIVAHTCFSVPSWVSGKMLSLQMWVFSQLVKLSFSTGKAPSGRALFVNKRNENSGLACL